MLTDTSKVHGLFHGMHGVIERKNDYSHCAKILRDMIEDHVVSGKSTVKDFLQPANARKWLAHIQKEYGENDAKKFYAMVLDVPKNFSVEVVDLDNQQVAEPKKKEGHKEKWMRMMGPIVKELVGTEITNDTFLEWMWAMVAQEKANTGLILMAKALYESSA